MMSQKPVFGFNEQKIVEAELEQNSKEKGDLIASVKDVVISQVKNLPPVENPNLTTERANHSPCGVTTSTADKSAHRFSRSCYQNYPLFTFRPSARDGAMKCQRP